MTAASAPPAGAGQPGAGLETNAVYCMDALELLRALPDGSVDAVITDPPYEGATALAWDKRIDWKAWFEEAMRVAKETAPIVMFANMRSAAALINGAPKSFRYEWVWSKSTVTGHPNAAHQPMRSHEYVLVFGKGVSAPGMFLNQREPLNYFPQMTAGTPYTYRTTPDNALSQYKPSLQFTKTTVNEGLRYPRSVLEIASGNHNQEHPTAKPLALMEYLVRTYTREGDLVLDPFCGSGTTLVAAKRLNRRFIGGDTDAGYCDVARQRLDEPYTLQLFADAAPEAG